MKLSKFLRKNSRTLIMVFMSLLLIAFLVPDTIQTLGGRERGQNRTFGRAFGQKVTDRDLDQARADSHLLGQMNPNWGIPDDAILDFYLLTEEAKRVGVRVGRDEVKSWLAAQGLDDQRLRRLQRATSLNYDSIYDSVGRFLAVERLGRLHAKAIAESLPRQELAYRDWAQEAVAQVTVLDDNAFVSRVPEPSEAELQAFFDEAKARETAHTADQLVFGYLLPDRVRLEYLTVDPVEVRDRITIQAVQVKRFFATNAQYYTKPDPVASQPIGGQLPQVQMTFEEAREQVRRDYREARAVEVAQSRINDIYLEAHRPWAATPRGEDGFAAPPSSELVSFEELAEKFSDDTDVEYGSIELSSEDDLRGIAGLGRAGLLSGRRYEMVPTLVRRVKGILDDDPRDGLPVFNVMEPAPVVLTTRNNPKTRQPEPYQAYLFRVVEVAPSAPPESLDDVREQVKEDWKLVKAHELAGVQAELLAAKAREVGLPAAVEQATELKEMLAGEEQAATQPAAGVPPAIAPVYVKYLEPYQPSRATRQSLFIRGVGGRVTNVAEAVFGLAGALADAGTERPVACVPVADRYKWVVAELEAIKSLYAGPFEAQLAQSQRVGVYRERQFFIEWNSPENVKERSQFVLEAPEQPEAP